MEAGRVSGVVESLQLESKQVGVDVAIVSLVSAAGGCAKPYSGQPELK
jgi:hypothetical protein